MEEAATRRPLVQSRRNYINQTFIGNKDTNGRLVNKQVKTVLIECSNVNAHPKWLQVPDSAWWTRWCCDVRDRTWRCQSQWDAHLSAWPFGSPFSASKDTKEKFLLTTWVHRRVCDEDTAAVRARRVPNSYLFGIVRYVEIRVNEENVFRLQIRVRQLVVVEEPYGVRELIANMAHLVQRVRLVIVVLLRNINNGHVTRSKRIKSGAQLTRKSKTDKPNISNAMHMWPW